MEWFNNPISSEITYGEENGIFRKVEVAKVHAAGKSDYWRKSHYGFIRDNGHFLYDRITGDFEVSVRVIGKYREIYDQGGFMVRENEENWIKAGIEYVDGIQNVSAVVTRDYSDWSVVGMKKENPPESIVFKMTMKQGSFEIFYSLDGAEFIMYRTGFLTSNPNLQVGIMCASPNSEDGFEIEFRDYKLRIL
ncbi:hypothetical protein SteCoe_5927 [Stentor coeruleus]|uniref:DUF1349 domain-containing protein n=1 Tax=Stentor coeruleus TaxID=5963 RepID=A0A1R2CRD3_9CILI|nr:hypothetical protein SteCoe_5927 [Stentor coeruleus]